MPISTALPTLSYFLVSSFFGLVGLNAKQKYRPLLLALVIFIGVLTFRAITADSLFGVEPDVLGMFVLIYISHISCALCVEK